MHVLSTVHDDGVATMTVSLADDDHKFDVWTEGNEALVEYQETLTYRGTIAVSEPDEEVFKALMVSDQMTEFLNIHGVNSVRRAEPTP
jgi:hypothetical protein